MKPLHRVSTRDLEIGYYDVGSGPAVVLLHGFPYDIHAYTEVTPLLVEHGLRVVVPYLRGCGATRFLRPGTPRSAAPSAFAADLVGLLDALRLDHAVLAGFDWGGRTAYASAALWPRRCAGLVISGSYLKHRQGHATGLAEARRECALWYQYYFLTERGRAGLINNRRAIAELLWRQWSPGWQFTAAEFERTAEAFDNPDWVDIALHNYRHRLAGAEADPQHAELARRLEAAGPITAPAITLDGASHGVDSVPEGGQAWEPHFAGAWAHRLVPAAGHNIPQEQPGAFADAVLAVTKGQLASPLTSHPSALPQAREFGWPA
jgi:pimeloyl-ACP methyl ester carboxylesterase